MLLLSATILSCGRKEKFEVRDFKPFSNFEFTEDTLHLRMDLSDAVLYGITIPSASEGSDGFFRFTFDVRNNAGRDKRYYYKVYYQNESYKFPETTMLGDTVLYNPRSSSNFYGSWEVCSEGFHVTGAVSGDSEWHTIRDSIRIVGNPRDEKKFYGADPVMMEQKPYTVEQVYARMKNSQEWMNQIREKARKNGITYEKQRYLDAMWTIREALRKGDYNNRWKRNPRVGAYSFLLVVATEEALATIPDHVRDISLAEPGATTFLNPYYYYLHEDSLNEKGIKQLIAKEVLAVSARLEPQNGIFVDEFALNDPTPDKSAFGTYCNDSSLFRSAHFEQFFHDVNTAHRYNNIPVVYDVTGDGYSREEYWKNAKKYSEKERLHDKAKITDCPCTTVGYDSVRQAIYITVPGNHKNEFRKENVGVKSRIGFTYGKFRAKIRFPALLSSGNVWNGLTCAFWMIYQADEDWNKRRPCEGGYIPKGEVGKTDVRIPDTYYTEIDIEIVKASRYWPCESVTYPELSYADNPAENRNLIVTCTNWDLACREPELFAPGVTQISFLDKTFTVHRWDDWYKALTSKFELPHDEVVNNILFYEIEWLPDRIIWRLGPSEDRMKVIGFMDTSITSIPDNQMLLIMSQEFHYGEWWPTSPFQQDNIPFPAEDITGYLYDVVIE